ncbi:MAG: adenosine deaminase [Pseudomonadota bacterium]
MSPVESAVPLAELHCHIEGAAPTELVRELGHRNGHDVSHLIDEKHGYIWSDFNDFLHVYDEIASVFTRVEDYENLAFEYASDLARQGAIYSEIFASTDHAQRSGVDPIAYLKALAEGQKRAQRNHGIVSRIVPIGVRQFGVEAVFRAAELVIEAAKTNDHLTGFGIAGAEDFGSLRDAKGAFQQCGKAGLGLTAHAGEWTGPQTIRDALDLGVTRIGHGIRAAEDAGLVSMLAERCITLEVCPASNAALGAVAADVPNPVRVLHQAGVLLTANSDDPPHFHTNLAADVNLLVGFIGGEERKLRSELTRNALNAAFVDEATRQHLIEKLDAALASAPSEAQ